MPDEKIPTNTLLQRLFKTSSLNRFIKRLDDDKNSLPLFHEYINQLCTEKEIPPERIIKKAEIERTYGHKFFNGTRKPSRDKVLQIAFGFEMDYEETQKLLSIARKSALHPKIQRDAVIIYALERGYDIVSLQATLLDLSLPLLGEDK